MSIACPHCDFLIVPAPRQPLPDACPQCGQALPAPPAHAGGCGTDAGAASTATPALASLLAPAPVTAAAPVQAAAAASHARAPTDPVASPAAVSAPAPAAPVPSTARARGVPLHRWQWPLVGVLGVLLGLQVLLSDRARLAADPHWRPLVEQACGLLRCSLPPWHEPAAFNMLERSVRPATTGALQVDAIFRNDARWAQAWPLLQLSLADADGRTLGSGVFTPEQYLGQLPEGLLAPGQSAQVTFVVQEPAAGTVAFAFRFH